MGLRLSTGGDATPDPVTGLTPAQIQAVRSTFDVLRSDPKDFGVDLFLSLFDAYPEYQKLFRVFGNIPRSELPNSKRFVAHASTVVYSLMSIIDTLNDSECLVEMLVRIGQNHGRVNVQPKSFEHLKAVIMELLQRRLKNRLTPFAEESWSKTLDVANSVIFKGLEDGRKEAIVLKSKNSM